MSKIIRCGEEPGGCGKFSDAVAEYDIQMAIPFGTGSISGTCYVSTSFPVSVPQLQATWDKTVDLGLIKLNIPTLKFTPKTYMVEGGYNSAWSLSPFFLGMRSKLVLSYGKNGHLYATLKSPVSTVLDATGSYTNSFSAPFCTAGDFGYGIVATLSPYRPADSFSGWHKCMGGWWSGARYCAGNSCYAGCTTYRTAVWNDVGTKYAHTGAHPTRVDGDQTWDLGEIDDPANYNVFIYGRAVRGQCANAVFDAASGAMVAKNYPIPPMSICPPSLNSVEMTRDICRSTVNATLNIHIPELGTGSATLHAQYVAANSENEALSSGSWTDKIVPNVAENSNISVSFDEPFIPDTTYYFKISLESGANASDELLICNQKTLYMPRPTCVVPLLTATECETITAGECIEELTEERMEKCC